MKSVITAVLLAVSLAGTGLSATTYRLFVHGRSGDSHCVGTGIDYAGSLNQATTDYHPFKTYGDNEDYWGGLVTGLANVRYIGFSSKTSGGAWSWNECGARRQLWYAMYLFCRGGNDCEIYTHSTGSLAVSSFFAHHGPDMAAAGVNIRRVQFMASASGGSELADIAVGWRTNPVAWATHPIITGMLWYFTADTAGLDETVTTYTSRAMFDHNQSYGYPFYTTSGTGWTFWGGITKNFLPGLDDSVLANHTLCNVNAVTDVEAVCGYGNTTFRHHYLYWKSWRYVDRYTYYGRWTPYYTIHENGSDHSQQRKYYTYR